jgi:predicted metal-dependent peptidase
MRQETAAAKRIQKARTSLLLDHPFFGTLLFRLKGRETSSVKTMATDGVSLFYNPGFVATLSAAELSGVLAHEVLHPGLQHHVRRGNRSVSRWNMACDYAINPLVIDAGLALPKDVLIDNRFRGHERRAHLQPHRGRGCPQRPEPFGAESENKSCSITSGAGNPQKSGRR